MRISHVIESFPNCFESIRKPQNNEHYILNRKEEDKVTTILNIDSNVDELHLLAGDLAMTAFLDISTQEKTEGIISNTTFPSNFNEIHILGIMKHHTFVAYIQKYKANNFYLYCKAGNLHTFTEWQKEILFTGVRVNVSNNTHNLTSHLPLKLKKYLFVNHKLTKEVRKEFKGNFYFHTSEQLIAYNKNNKAKLFKI